ncbi:MAG: hypothetical protein ACK5PQ_03285 [Alphaproteobacteria bacterium]
MPQLDISVYPSQLFWLGLSFMVLYGFMRWMVTPRVSRILYKRTSMLEKKLEDIDVFRKEIEHLENQVTHLREIAYKRNQELLTEAQKKYAQLLEKEEALLAKKTSERLEDFELTLQKKIRNIEAELSESSSEIKDLILEKILGTSQKDKN